jgi:hypothetical protein
VISEDGVGYGGDSETDCEGHRQLLEVIGNAHSLHCGNGFTGELTCQRYHIV